MLKLKRILLVEDSANDVELTLTALESIHLANAVDVAEDGVEALDYLHCRGRYADRPEGYPVVIVLDLKLPRISGLEVLKMIKSDPVLGKIPVVILTSSRLEKDMVEGYHLGANAYVVKPVDFTNFAVAIKELGYFWAVINEVPPLS